MHAYGEGKGNLSPVVLFKQTQSTGFSLQSLALLYDSYADQVQALTHARQELCRWAIVSIFSSVLDVIDLNVKLCKWLKKLLVY